MRAAGEAARLRETSGDPVVLGRALAVLTLQQSNSPARPAILIGVRSVG
jgi:hypothetical protein